MSKSDKKSTAKKDTSIHKPLSKRRMKVIRKIADKHGEPGIQNPLGAIVVNGLYALNRLNGALREDGQRGLCAEDFFRPDDQNGIAFDNGNVWKNGFKHIKAYMIKKKQCFEADWLLTRPYWVDTRFIDIAIQEVSYDDNLFDYELWKKGPRQLEKLINAMNASGSNISFVTEISNAEETLKRIQDEKKKGKAVDTSSVSDKVAQASGKSKASKDIDNLIDSRKFGIEKLTQADVHQPKNGKKVTFKPLLSLKETWARIAEVQTKLKRKKTSLTLEHLRLIDPGTKMPFLLLGAQFGHFDEIKALLQKNGERLSREDFVGKHGRKSSSNLIKILGEQSALGKAFMVADWLGHMDELKEIVPDISQRYIKQFDLSGIMLMDSAAQVKKLRQESTARQIELT